MLRPLHPLVELPRTRRPSLRLAEVATLGEEPGQRGQDAGHLHVGKAGRRLAENERAPEKGFRLAGVAAAGRQRREDIQRRDRPRPNPGRRRAASAGLVDRQAPAQRGLGLDHAAFADEPHAHPVLCGSRIVGAAGACRRHD